MDSLRFANLLVRHRIVDADAVENPDGYDNSATLDRIRTAFTALEAEAVQPLREENERLRERVYHLSPR